MKRIYFTPDSIQWKADEMLRQVEGVRMRDQSSLLPQRSTLLVLDMQRYFLEPDSHAFVPSAPAIIPNIISLMAAFCQNKCPIVFTRHVNTVLDAAMMAFWWRDLIDPNDSLSHIADAFDLSRGHVIEKHQYDAFHGTELESVLKENAVTQVVICGVMTHLCCETTARSAFMRGFEVFFAIDGTATYNVDFHMASLLNLSHGFARPVLVSEVLASLRSESED